MKKIMGLLCFFIIILSYNLHNVSAKGISAFDAYGEAKDRLHLSISGRCVSKADGSYINIDSEGLELYSIFDLEAKTRNTIFSNVSEDEWIIALDARSEDEENRYPEIEELSFTIKAPEKSGGRSNLFGKDYRVYRIEDESLIPIDIEKSNKKSLHFVTDKLGIYVIYFNSAMYDVTFYADKIEYDDDYNIITDVYYEKKNLKIDEAVPFPEIPAKDGYVFCGWIYTHQQGSYIFDEYVGPQPVKAFDIIDVHGLWCPEDEYTPLEIMLSTDEKIVKGKEDGAVITLTLSEGSFRDDLWLDWRDGWAEDPEWFEKNKEEILSEWKTNWNIVGSDEIFVDMVEKIDAKTLKIKLSGNSSDIYTNSEIKFEFNSSLYNPYYRGDYELYPDADVKLDEDGVVCKMFSSDNSIKLSKQSRPGGNAGLGTAKYAVLFDSNNGSEVIKQTVTKNTLAKEPQIPEKDGYVFAGWFSDYEFTTEYDFSEKVTKNITLYAKWEDADNAENQIVLTIGKKEAVVFGEIKVNDVAPVLKDDTAFLPVRFVSENLGAKVLWDNGVVTVLKDEAEIVIKVGENKAWINGEETELKHRAFIENDRTYVPLCAILESFGVNVEWVAEGMTVKLTTNAQ